MKTLKSVVQKNQSTTILIGQENDFSEKEIMAIENDYQPITLGKQTRLRTETAAIVACHSVAFNEE
jgi:16S rRNA (uracil1498-N3)-methyltransferase